MPFVDATGLQIKTIEEILEELSAQQKAEIDATLNTAPDEPLGQLNGIFAAQLREIWEVAQVAYNGFNPDAAEGFLLEKLSALTGTLREGATKSTVEATLDIDLGSTLVAGTHFANVVGDPDNRWTPVADYVGTGGGVQLVDFEAENAGAIVANAGTITVISTPVVGWNSVTNAADANVGKEIDTDAELRQRREEELRATGSSTVDAIRADVLADEDVEQCTVFENTSDTVDSNGVPPHTIEVVVYDGTPPQLTNNYIAQLIFDTKGGGIGTFGTESGTAVDSLGSFHTVYFSRPTEVTIWLDATLEIDISSGYAGSAAAKSALVGLNESTLLVGRDFFANAAVEVLMALSGVYEISALLTGITNPPTLSYGTLVIGPRQLGRIDTGRITINENFGPIP